MKHRTILLALPLFLFTTYSHQTAFCQSEKVEQIVEATYRSAPVLSFKTGRVLFAETTEADAAGNALDVASEVHVSRSSGILLYGSVGGTYTPADYSLANKTEVAGGKEELSAGEGADRNLPTEYALLQNYPNPFNPSTMIRFDLPERSHVKITIYDALGRDISIALSEELAAGRHGQLWEGRNHHGLPVASGVYFYRIEARSLVSPRSLTAVKKMIVLK